jgi:tRNA 2-selenouridine synthase
VTARADLAALLTADTPFLDVRAPAEFERGAVPGAVNLPLLDDDERHQVGLTYKQHGHDAAVALGHQLVSGEVRRARERAWQDFARRHPDTWIYCWRGGQRSAIVQQWLAGLGTGLPRVPGGFKALRHECLAVLEHAPRQKRWVVLAGRTGSGKTQVLERLDNAIDLEGLAAHRGSAFGGRETPQPPPVSFENALAVAFLRHRGPTLVLEDESRTIGRLALPEAWHAHMQTVPLALLEVPMAERVRNIEREYVAEPLAHGVPAEALQQRYADALGRIERRLGGARRQAVQAELERAFAAGSGHGAWIERLLEWYYDPMYDYQLERKRSRVAVRGAPAEIEAFLQDGCPG